MASVHDELVDLTVEYDQLTHLELTITGYNDDPRSLYEVPEVRRWMTLVAARWPDLCYWLTPGTLWVYVLALNPDAFQRLPDGQLRIALDPEQVLESMLPGYLAAEAILEGRGMPREHIDVITGRAQQNFLAMLHRKKFGDYMVVHPKSGTVTTYRRETDERGSS